MCVCRWLSDCVCCLVIRFLFTIIIYIYLLLCYAQLPPPGHGPAPPRGYPFNCAQAHTQREIGKHALAFFGHCFCWTQILKCFVFRQFCYFATAAIWKLSIWSVACKMQLRCCTRTCTHTHPADYMWKAYLLVFFYFPALRPLSFTYFSVTKPETICCFIPLCLGPPSEFMRCARRGAANVCSINEIIASKCVMMKLFWVTS